MPSVTYLSSPCECAASSKVNERSSLNAMDTSRNESRCLRRLVVAFFESHSNSNKSFGILILSFQLHAGLSLHILPHIQQQIDSRTQAEAALGVSLRIDARIAELA